jgi:Ca2+-binding EF-hand superfamily protein
MSIFEYREFLLAINITAKGNPQKKLRWAFQMYDVNGDGHIDIDEMLQIIQVSE